MALLDQLLSGLTGVSGSALRGVLMNVLGQGGSQTGGAGGGLGGLLSSFEQAGLGHIAQSWISSGPNQPVSPQHLQTVFGEDQVQTMSRQSGMAPHDFLSQLSQHLPRVVDHMTPNGQMPDEGTMSV
jgi:uncharacterized protein YidB (DUF937 family)